MMEHADDFENGSNLTQALNATATSLPTRWKRIGPLVDRELRRIAVGLLRQWVLPNGQASIEASELVSEFYLRVLKDEKTGWVDRKHFFAHAAACMRSILIDRHRKRSAARRFPLASAVGLDGAASPRSGGVAPQVEIRLALEKLSTMSARQAAIVNLRFFQGWSFSEIATALNLSEKTVQRDWLAARAWLYTQLSHSLASA